MAHLPFAPFAAFARHFFPSEIRVHPCPSMQKPCKQRAFLMDGRPLSAKPSVTRRVFEPLCHHWRSRTLTVIVCFLVQTNNSSALLARHFASIMCMAAALITCSLQR